MPDTDDANTDGITAARERRYAGLKPPWKPGQSGNPKGRPKKIIEPILRELANSNPDGKGIIADRIAWKVVEMALKGNMKAMAMLLDRYDGKVADVIEGGDERRPLRLIIEGGNGKPEEEG